MPELLNSSLDSLFSSMSGVAGWCLLRTIIKQASSLYLCKFGKVSEKATGTSETGSILWKLWDYRLQLTSSEIQHRRFARNLPKLSIASLKDKKTLQRQYEEKSAFQTIATELYKTNTKNKKKAHEISNSLYWSRCGCQN